MKLTINPIDTQLKNLITFLGHRARVSDNRFSSFYGILILALFLIVFKGSSINGQPGFFSSVVKEYIEETAASVVAQNVSHNQLADISSLAVVQNLGQGGDDAIIELAPIQDSSLVSNNPVSLDYLDFGFRKNEVLEYTVQAGDTLSFIASDYGVSVESVIWANDLPGENSIKPDQVLRIPPVNGVIHKVKAGDTLVSISKKYGVDLGKILEFNRLKEGDELSLNEEIMVPDGRIIPPPKAKTIAKTSVKTIAKAAVSQFSHLTDLGDFFFIPTSGHNWKRIHGRNGVDVANSCGTPIYASADGTAAIVDGAGWNGGFGQFIKLTHANGTETLYAHASKLLIVPGQAVQRGQKIALMGTTGRSTGCHLHFEVHGAKNPLVK